MNKSQCAGMMKIFHIAFCKSRSARDPIYFHKKVIATKNYQNKNLFTLSSRELYPALLRALSYFTMNFDEKQFPKLLTVAALEMFHMIHENIYFG
jgi:hypothetical protein